MIQPLTQEWLQGTADLLSVSFGESLGYIPAYRSCPHAPFEFRYMCQCIAVQQRAHSVLPFTRGRMLRRTQHVKIQALDS